MKAKNKRRFFIGIALVGILVCGLTSTYFLWQANQAKDPKTWQYWHARYDENARAARAAGFFVEQHDLPADAFSKKLGREYLQALSDELHRKKPQMKRPQSWNREIRARSILRGELETYYSACKPFLDTLESMPDYEITLPPGQKLQLASGDFLHTISNGILLSAYLNKPDDRIEMLNGLQKLSDRSIEAGYLATLEYGLQIRSTLAGLYLRAVQELLISDAESKEWLKVLSNPRPRIRLSHSLRYQSLLPSQIIDSRGHHRPHFRDLVQQFPYYFQQYKDEQASWDDLVVARKSYDYAYWVKTKADLNMAPADFLAKYSPTFYHPNPSHFEVLLSLEHPTILANQAILKMEGNVACSIGMTRMIGAWRRGGKGALAKVDLPLNPYSGKPLFLNVSNEQMLVGCDPPGGGRNSSYRPRRVVFFAEIYSGSPN